MTTLTDTDLLALTCWGEARNQEVEGLIAVAAVLRNRLVLGRWGATYGAVARAPKQFSCWNPGDDLNHIELMVLASKIQQDLSVSDVVLRECYWIADGCQSGRMLDNTNGATHYYAASLTPPPSWAEDHTTCARIGTHLFFRGIA